MKKKSKYLVLLLLLLVICGGMVTYAIYKTNKSGAATVNAARWNVVFKNGETEISDNFDISLSNATWTNPLGNVASGKIAPGSQATFYITIDATDTETSVDYTAEIDESFNESDFEVTLAEDSGTIPYSTVENAMIRQIPIRVVWNGNINDNNTKNNDDLLKKARDITIPIKLTAAQKLALKYTVTFNDGAGNTISSRKVDEGETIGTLPENPTRLGYTFTGWYDDPTNGNQVTTETLVNQGMNIYAHWNIKYITVTFDSNGGSAVSSQQVQEGATFSSIPSTTKSGSEFLGWYDSNENELTLSTVIMNEVTYTASWFNAYSRSGQIVYFDPKTTNTCDSNTFDIDALRNNTSSCHKWRIIKEDGDNAILQLDYNIPISNVHWNDTGDNNDGPITALNNLVSLTSLWTRVPALTYEYDTTNYSQNYGKLSCTNGTCTITKTGQQISNLRTRLITLEEYNAIPNKNWTVQNMEGTRPECGLHIYGNTGCPEAYWFLTPADNSGNAKALYYYGHITDFELADFRPSLRPVITLSKTTLGLD